MKTLQVFAKATNNWNLEGKAKAINNGSTGDISFYSNGNCLSVSHLCGVISESEQKDLLKWFLKYTDKSYAFITA